MIAPRLASPLALLALLAAACGDDGGRTGGSGASGAITSATATTTATATSDGSSTTTTGESDGVGDTEAPTTSGEPTTTTTTTGDATTTTSTTSTSTTTTTTTTTSTSTTEPATTGEPMKECETELVATVRDFQESHPDFEGPTGAEQGLVEFILGGDNKPVYAGGGGTKTTHGQMFFDQWYRDVGGVNQSFPVVIPLTDNGMGAYVFDDPDFFPIDGQGFGNQGNPHNYHFTLELHTKFQYEGGEVFSFTGDDDLFVFVNGRLAIDLGGVHGPMNGQVDMDAQANALAITPGNTYSLDFFFAERHTSQSNFHIETTIGCIQVIPG